MSAFSPRQMFLLDEACKPIQEAFGRGLYLVGTAVQRQEYRDVDVRLILTDKKYEKLRRAVGDHGVTFLGLAIGEYLASRTGMPIDFQFQQQTTANEKHDGMRNPIGVRSLGNYMGDARPVGGERMTSIEDEAATVACPHWSPGRITMRTGCTACTADAEPSNTDEREALGNLT